MSREKVVSENKAVKLSQRYRNEGKRVVTTNGSFDVFHFGHVILLEEAKRQGDILIVGLNSDTSVRAYKGPNRPINPEAARAGVLAAMEAVDHVFLFDDTTPIRWLERIRPAVHCNSSEYGSDCVERPTLDAIGARLKLVGRNADDGLSTTEILRKLKAS
ncbi:MAG: adenylyltransferase/cytidyltransferase family protein [Candidatus Moranbacteria bacterium]|nr:adenylyltransferase/cytidyltransferase family protein [Candidatus Moranbacteria bacterium]